MKLNFRRFVAILLVAMMTLTALPTAGIAEVMQDVSRESGSIRMLMVEPDDETYYTYEFYDEDGTTLIASQIVKSGDTLLEPAAPAKANKKFVQWNPQVTFDPVGELTGENKTIKVTAEYTEVYYVFFVDHNGRVVTTKEAADGAEVATADVLFPVEADHAITGWYTDAAFTNPVTTVTIDKANVTLYAKVEAGHWLTFDSKGGSYVAPVFVSNGKTATQPTDPTRPGYAFDGWDFDFNTVLTADAIATAKWTANDRTRYTVIHWQENADDNEYSYVESETKYGATGATTAAAAKRYTGFTAQNITQQTIAGDGSTIVNVYYKRNEYFVKFYNRYGSSEYTQHRITAKYGANIRDKWPGGGWFVSRNGSVAQTNIDVMPLNGTSFYGKQDGWNESTASYYTEVLPGEESSGTRMSNGKYYKLDHQDTTNSNGGLTVTDEDRYPMTGFTVNTRLSTRNRSDYNGAKFYYDRNELKVIYINVSVTAKETSYKYQQDISAAGKYVPDAPAGMEDFTFAGWYADADGNAPYDFTGKTMPAQNITVYAKWEAPTYTITFYKHDGEEYGPQTYVKYGERAEYDENEVGQYLYTPKGYEFLGWVQEDGTPFNFETKIYRNYELYAKVASKAAYSVTYDANGGSGDVPVDGQKYAEKALADVKPADGLTPPQGKEIFLGWSTNPEATTAEVYPYGKLTIGTADVTLYAIWGVRENTVAITYKGNGGALTDGQTEYTIPSLPNNGKIEVAQNTFVKAGYNFVSWNTQANGQGTSFAPSTDARVNGEGKNVLYAIWEAAEQNYTVEFYYENANGTYTIDNTLTATRTAKTGETVSVTEDDKAKTKDAQYVFDPKNGNNVLSGEIPATGTLVLKLYFKLNTAQYTIHHYLLGTMIPVAPDQPGTMQIGQTLTAEPATERMEGTNEHSYAPRKTITITADPTKNVITVYYTKDVKFTGQSDTLTYNSNEQELSGIEVEGLLDGNTWTGLSYSAKGKDVGEYTGEFTGAPTFTDANGKEVSYYNVIPREGKLTITPNTDEVTVTITGNHDSKVYNGSEQSVTGYTTDVGDKTIDVALKEGSKAEAKGTDADHYPMGLTANDFTVTSKNYSNIKVVVVDGYLDITPITDEVTVTITGNHDSKVYNGSEQSVTGYTTDVGEKTITVALKEGSKAEAKGTDADHYPMGLTANDFTVTSKNYSNIKVVVVDGYLEITPITDEVTVTITGNTDTKVYNGKEHAVTGYTTDVGDKTITVALKEGKAAEAKGTNANTYPMGLTEADFTVTSDNYSNIKVVVNDGSLEITPVTEKVTVTIEGHKGTFKYDGKEHTVTGYDVTDISNSLYTEADFTFSGTAEVKGKNASESPYPMGLNASQFANVSGNFSNVEFVVTDGEMTINPRNITIRANDNTVEYDGKPHGENGYTLEGDGLAEGETILGLIIDGEQTEAGFYPGELKPHDALIGAEGEEINPKNYKIDYANGNLEITPVAAEVVVTITEHGGKAKYDGTEHVVTGYDVTSISNPLYTEADFEFKGKAEVKGIDAGSYPMLLKSADFVNTSKNFDKVTFVIVDATLEIEKREVTLTSASDEKVYDGKALTNDEVTVSGDGFVEGEGAYCGVTGRQLNVGESDNEFTYELLRGTKAGNYKITKEYGTLKVTPVTEEVVVTITGHKGSAKYDGSEKTVTGYDVTGISNPLYTENDFTFSGDATASGIHAGKYPMGLKAEDFKNTSENFANVKFMVEDGEMEIQKIALTITSESYEGDYDAQWHQVGYTAEGLAATDAITALEMKNHRILKPGEMVSEFVANTLKITHADGSDATGDYEVTFVPGKLTVNTVIVNYRVFYYYDGVLDESEIEEGTGEVLTQITEYKDKPKDMQFDHVTGFPLTLGLDEMKNIIRVYYVHTPLTGNLGAANIGDCIE